uniref:Golgi apparatus membrane protein TVP23 homolog n=1 Tax=Anopheles minimus TaxID=112268 RepID=A0A182W627_9DIPT
MAASAPLLEESVPFDEDDINYGDRLANRVAHPYVTFFHIAFRSAAVLTYLFCGWFSDSFITSFVFVVLLLSADFWTVKNITGRLLVGLRWWNYVDDNGVSHWIFESKNESQSIEINSLEKRVFWVALMASPVVWAFFFIVALFGLKFKWLLLVLIALVLNGANLYGYIKCNFGSNANISTTTTDFVKSQVLKNAVNFMASSNKPDTGASVKNKQPANTKPLNTV